MNDILEEESAAPAPEPIELDISACDREPIHIPGSTQPHGLMLIADAETLRVVGGAGDIEQRLARDWTGRMLSDLLDQEVDASVAQPGDAAGMVTPLAAVHGPQGALDATLHRSGAYLLVELEPVPVLPMSATEVLARLDTTGAAFERAIDLRQLCDRAAVAFRSLTGFDRVMIYRFLDDAAGTVVAEDRVPALGSFMHHHFPASDIPAQARALYVRNRVRVIPDIAYAPAPIRGDDPGLAGIDLSDVALRSVSPIHLQYLKNMGVGASASVSIVKDGLLWGLVACHHHAPRLLGYEVRAACRALAGGLSRQIRAREQAETYRERIRLRGVEDAIVGRFESELPFDAMLGSLADEMRAMVDADGFAAVQGARLVTAGRCPPSGDIAALARWAMPRAAVEPYATHMLGARLPAAQAYREEASGLLAVSLASEAPTLLMWFRAEEPETVEWAGNPHKEASGEAGELTPRKSFEAWTEVLRGQARRWTLVEVEAAARLRRALFDVRQHRRLRELNRELAQSVADREALLVEKDHLLREVNHRVQNSLQLVNAFLGLQARAEDNEVVAAHLGEAQRRLSAVALVHRQLYQADNIETIDLGRYLDDLIGEMRMSMGEEWQRAFSLDLSPMPISADRAVNIGLVLTELVINANKYAYGGGVGPIAISLQQYRNQFRMVVADQGAGQTRTREGFGTRMMNAMVQRLGGVIERADNKPGLRVIVSAPIAQD